jgi:hypothetical protein
VLYDTLLNPVSGTPYVPDFRMLIDSIDVAQRRVLESDNKSENTTHRQLTFYITEYVSPNNVSYALNGSNTIEVGMSAKLVKVATTSSTILVPLIIALILF